MACFSSPMLTIIPPSTSMDCAILNRVSFVSCASSTMTMSNRCGFQAPKYSGAYNMSLKSITELVASNISTDLPNTLIQSSINFSSVMLAGISSIMSWDSKMSRHAISSLYDGIPSRPSPSNFANPTASPMISRIFLSYGWSSRVRPETLRESTWHRHRISRSNLYAIEWNVPPVHRGLLDTLAWISSAMDLLNAPKKTFPRARLAISTPVNVLPTPALALTIRDCFDVSTWEKMASCCSVQVIEGMVVRTPCPQLAGSFLHT